MSSTLTAARGAPRRSGSVRATVTCASHQGLCRIIYLGYKTYEQRGRDDGGWDARRAGSALFRPGGHHRGDSEPAARPPRPRGPEREQRTHQVTGPAGRRCPSRGVPRSGARRGRTGRARQGLRGRARGVPRGQGADLFVSTPDTPLAGLRIVECATFVAGPSGGMALAQLGAEVIRVDLPQGGGDHGRWPVAPNGTSLYWNNLNKGKRSVALDFRAPEGRELLAALATADGPANGIYLDNVAGRTRLRYEELAERRRDVIHVHVQGKPDGKPAVDYTANAEVGVPDMTGPQDHAAPVNHVLPAWDFLTGMTAATGVLAALHRRAATGEGSGITVALSDVALAAVGNLGWLAEARLAGRGRPRHGNHTFGSFGVDFPTADGRRVMVLALTPGQWDALCAATGTTKVFTALEPVFDADLSTESDRYRLRDTIEAILRPWFEGRGLTEIGERLDRARVLWGPYRDTHEAATLALADPGSIVTEIDQPGVGAMVAAAGPLRWSGSTQPPRPAPLLGTDTDEVLSRYLGLSAAELGRLHDAGLVSGPTESQH
ncbi:2-methylfumaryl-CoA isomerase [Prauserella endophytica]|uniref:2-methylfumaryl-CoA isomerase n=1 Tax=Prauserella endophytica TaxID=1592324 RepID=A0ABY2SA99_9PSEU|nr:2-methylfumaryl-CoA isomerase [Prauserella endophytica]